MLVYHKQPDGSWKRSGEILPTETQVTIAINAELHDPMMYYPDEAIQLVESSISYGFPFNFDGTAWRFEIVGASSKAKRRGK